MRTSSCRCGNRIYVDNIVCLGCSQPIGHCDCCGELTSFTPKDEARFECDRICCGKLTYHCKNREFQACNAMVEEAESLCRWCRFTEVVPPLDVPRNIRRWIELERAKRGLLRELKELALPPFAVNPKVNAPLVFHFKTDRLDEQGMLHPAVTGHAAGVITVNCREADSVFRERTRVAFNEPQRTLIGHFRHEIGHYFDWAFVQNQRGERYRELFGDYLADYEHAKEIYYADGPPDDWRTRYVSAYAAMHPCEDFAETVNVYLDLMALAVTANDHKIVTIDLGPFSAIEPTIGTILRIATMASEFNHDLGLPPLIPENMPESVIEKIAFVHSLRRLTSTLPEEQAAAT